MDVKLTNLLKLHDVMSGWSKVAEERFQQLVESVSVSGKVDLRAKGMPGNDKVDQIMGPVGEYSGSP